MLLIKFREYRLRARNGLIVGFVVLSLVLAASSVVLAQDDVDAPAIDPRAEKVLTETSRYIGQAKTLAFVFQESFDEIDETGLRIQYSNRRRVGLRRPNKLAAESRGDTIDREFRYNGSRATLLDRRHNVYATVDEVPETVDGLLNLLASRFGLVFPLEDLLYEDTFGGVMSGVDRAAYLGIHEVGEFKCHHLAFTQSLIDWQLWVEAGPTPIPRKIVINYNQEPGQPAYQAVITDWRVDLDLPDELFEFTPPDGARRIEIELLDEADQQ